MSVSCSGGIIPLNRTSCQNKTFVSIKSSTSNKKKLSTGKLKYFFKQKDCWFKRMFFRWIVCYSGVMSVNMLRRSRPPYHCQTLPSVCLTAPSSLLSSAPPSSRSPTPSNLFLLTAPSVPPVLLVRPPPPLPWPVSTDQGMPGAPAGEKLHPLSPGAPPGRLIHAPRPALHHG